ncbi:MAG: flagellar export protein FliJ [Hydrogenovibrio crunogenus]|uniref:Flagellar FliJ protein n=1 Tax=Hydrogenovibrio crunogenus (strain DSM 25203 / XCL-2) TaxID=317025 RepID=Q31FP3_HYDCU|nr:flagellar export protein FliJ [Hydrogenovibrio crunogenus]
MANSKVKRFEMLVELAQDELDKAQETFIAVRQQLESSQEQLDSLQDYHTNHLSKIHNEKEVTTAQLQTTQAFIDNVNKAILSQKDQITQLTHVLEKAQETWIEKRARHQSLKNIHLKLKRDERVKLDKQEQKMLDELASQQFFYSKSSE